MVDYDGYELGAYQGGADAVEFGRLYRKGSVWKFEAIGKGYNGGLQALVDKYQ